MEQERSKNKNELAVTTKDGFLKKFSPMSMVVEYRKIQTVRDAIEAEPNALSFYSREFGELTVIGIVEAHVIGLNDSINVKIPLTPLQMKEIAVEIQTTYYFLSMAEILYVFRKAKKGGYGKLYSALSMPTILDWFAQYTEERIKHFMDNQRREHDKHKSDNSLRSEEKKVMRRHDQLIREHKEKNS